MIPVMEGLYLVIMSLEVELKLRPCIWSLNMEKVPNIPGETVLSAVKLFVGVSLPGQEREGSVFEFEVNLDNTLTFIRKKEHIAGKIVSMTWKY